MIREGADGPEILLLRRSEELRAFGGFWAFPGGSLEAVDGDETHAETFRRAAVRETEEETSLRFAGGDLIPVCSWTTPEGMPRRYENWFFLARAVRGSQVRVDGREMVEHRWLTPERILDEHRVRSIQLVVPAFIFAHRMLDAASADDLWARVLGWPWEDLRPRTHQVEGGRLALYQGDACYGDQPPLSLDAPGGRHRLFMLEDGWRYERDLRDTVPVTG